MSNPHVDMDAMLSDLAQAKRDEELAKLKRIQAEERILSWINNKPDKGRVKIGDAIKGSVEFKLIYSADVDGIRTIDEEGLPVTFVSAWEFDAKAYEALRDKRPALFAKVAKFVTTKPAKPSFELKL